MTEEISVGVRILLERAKSNPDEMSEEYGKWAQLREAVFEYKEDGKRRPWVRGLTEEEITMLYDAFSSLHRKLFDAHVMKNVLDQDEEKEEYVGQAALNKAMAKRGLLAQFPPPVKDPNYNPYQNTIQPGSWQTVATGTLDAEPSPAFIQKIKKGLGL
jgi:hypothetical protein